MNSTALLLLSCSMLSHTISQLMRLSFIWFHLTEELTWALCTLLKNYQEKTSELELFAKRKFLDCFKWRLSNYSCIKYKALFIYDGFLLSQNQSLLWSALLNLYIYSAGEKNSTKISSPLLFIVEIEKKGVVILNW